MKENLNKKGFHILTGALIVSMVGLSSCGEKEFHVEGEVNGAADKTVVLEKADFHGRWTPVDSAKVSDKGTFSIAAPSPAAPEIYRLSMDGRYVYLPVEGEETLKVESSASDFGVDFNVTGSALAEQMTSFEKELLALDFNDDAKKKQFKREVYSKYLKDARGSVLSYYVLTKTVGDQPLYDITDKEDTKYYAAVATSFDQYHPDDPHAKMLKEASLNAMRRNNSEAGKKRMLQAEEIKIIDLELPDENGKNVKLSDLAGKGKKTVLVVSMMNEPASPKFNADLAAIYIPREGRMNIYHVSIDEDRYAWRDAAKNLPWTTVYDGQGHTSDILTKYNIGMVPVFFIYDESGNLTDRVESLDELSKKI